MLKIILPLALATTGLQPVSAACTPVAPPSTIGSAAQQYLASREDRRFIPALPTTPEGWQEVQTRSARAGERWIAGLVGAGEIEVQWIDLGGVRSAIVTPANGTAQDGPIVFNLHGGGYALNGGNASLYSAAAFALGPGLASVTVDYRLTPHAPYPAALEDAVAAYRALLERHDASQVAVYGLSAGGGLGAAFLLEIERLGLPMPSSAVLNSPWVDLTNEGDTVALLDCHDPLLGRSRAVIDELGVLYAGNRDLRDPGVSPLFADWTRIDVPVLLITGTRDLLMSDTVRLHRKMWDSGLDADLIVHEGMWHAFSVEGEFDHMLAQVAAYVRARAQEARGESLP
ncbi:MAG: esterase [Citromicrobium sp.]|nr:esterase [Citromicrobium sp.]